MYSLQFLSQTDGFVKYTLNFNEIVQGFNLHRTHAVPSCIAILLLDMKSCAGCFLTLPKVLELLLAWKFFCKSF